jgi:hypothetical protein
MARLSLWPTLETLNNGRVTRTRESYLVGGTKDISKCYAITVRVHAVIRTKVIQAVVLTVLHPQRVLILTQFSAQSFQFKLRRNMFTGLIQYPEYEAIFPYPASTSLG